jgi:hypothetical protein
MVASFGSLVCCFLSWTEVAHEPTYKAFELSNEGGINLTLQKWSFGLLCAMATYLAWTFGTAPLRKYARLMVLFGAAFLVILTSTRPWDWNEIGLKPSVIYLACVVASVIYLLSGIGAVVSTRGTVQPK